MLEALREYKIILLPEEGALEMKWEGEKLMFKTGKYCLKSNM